MLQGRPELILVVKLYPSRYCTDLVCSIYRESGPDGQIMYKVFNDTDNDFMMGELVRTGW